MDEKGMAWKKLLVMGVILVGLIAGIKGVLFWKKASAVFSYSERKAVSVFTKRVSEMKAEGDIASDQIAILQELVEIVSRKEATFMGTVLGVSVGLEVLEDGNITEEESEDLYFMRDLLRERNGKISFSDAARLMKEKPRLKEILAKMKKKETE